MVSFAIKVYPVSIPTIIALSNPVKELDLMLGQIILTNGALDVFVRAQGYLLPKMNHREMDSHLTKE